MRTLLSAVLLAAFLLPSTQAEVTLKSAVNGASYQNAALPNGKLAQGVLFIAFGQGMGPTQIVRATSFPLPDDLSDTSISVTVGSTTVKCIILYTTATQVAGILPSNTPAGDGTMIATYKGTDSAPLNVTVVAHNFGIFAVNQGGNGPGVFTDPVTNAANSLINAANPDNLLDIWGTGIGAANGDDGAGPLPGDMTSLNVQAFVGGKEAQILYRGRSGCCAGVDQVRIKIPAVSGCYVPVYLVVEGVVSNFISMSAVASGKTCSDPGGFSSEELQNIAARGGYKTATVTAFRIRGRAAQNPETRSDTLGAGFNNVSLQALLASHGNPALNTCWVVQFPTATPPSPEYLDAGKISATGPVGPYDLVTPQGYVGLYTLTFYPGYPVATPGVIGDGTLLKPGTYTFTGAGGSKVGPFTVSLDAPFTFEWTNRDSITAIDRSQPLPVTWTGGTAGGYVSIQGQSSIVAGVGAAFSCWVDAALGSFTVPASILSALPASYLDSHGKPQGALTVVESVNGQTFKPDGIDYGIAQFFDGFDHGVIAYQ
jgi:uncharacterized protein (TIGR03437 family)